MSLQIPPSHTNQVSQWSSFEVYTWIAKHNDKLGLSQDDLDSIEESPLSGKQLLSKDDEQLSQEWAISIHSARKIVKKTSQMQRKVGKRKSEPIINILNNGSLNNNITDAYSNTHIDPNPVKKTSFEKTNGKASTNPSLKNIPENNNVVYASASSPKQYANIIRQSPRVPPFTPKYGSNSFSIGSQYQHMQHMQYQESLLQTKLTLSIKNDTFMARLSHPKWWMDGHFNHIPNKIGCKNSVSIDITGDLDTPLVGLLAFTLTLDPRYATSHHNASNGYAFSPFVGTDAPQISPHIPSWMIGPGGLPYIPPSVAKLYELQQQYISKLTQLQKEKADKKQQSERKKRRKEVKKRMKEQAKQQRLQIKREKRKIKREERRLKLEQKLQKKEEDAKKENDTNKESMDANVDANVTETEEKEKEEKETDGNDSVIEKSSEEDTDSVGSFDETDSLSEYSVVSEEEEDVEDELEIDEAPKYRLIILWSITPHKGDGKPGGGVRGDRRDNVALNSMAMMSVASSDLLNQMNRFNVLLLQDDTDPDGPDEFNLDNSYFNELEQAALIADIEQCLVDNEHFEIAATFGTSPISNTYTLQIDIDDSLGDWPGPLQQFNSNNPFALGFIPTNQNPLMHPYAMMNMMQQQQPYTPYGRANAMQMQPSMFSYPDITMIHGKNKVNQGATSTPDVLIPPKSGGRSRANSHPIPPIGIGTNGIDKASDQQRLSKMFTLNDVLSVSRDTIPENRQLPAGLASPIKVSQFGGYTPTGTGSGRMQWGQRPRRKNSRAVRAPRLSLWKEQIANLSNQHIQQIHAKNNLYVPPSTQSPQQPAQKQSHQMSALPPTSPELQSHAQTLPHLPVAVQYNIGDCVFVDDSKLGQIKSIGQHPAWGKGTYYGIRLTEKIGICDGEYKGQRTFSCPSNYGYFVQRNQLTQKLKTTRFDFMAEDYIEDKKKEFEKLKADKEAKKQFTGQDQFAAEIMHQQQKSDDEDPGESDIPKPGTNVGKIMGQSSSERILSKSKPSGKYVPQFEKIPPKKDAKKHKSVDSNRRQRRNSKPLNEVAPKANPTWTGGAPRTIVVRNKIPPIKQHTGYLHCIEGIRFQQQMEWKKAINKFKLGIALLEVSLTNIDRSMTKRKWKAQIEEFRHKMSRCTFEIQNNKRNRFIKKRDANAQKQAKLQQEAALQLQAQKMADAKAQVVKREDNWKVTREDMDKKIAENEIDPNYDPSTGIRPDSDDSDDVNSGRLGGDKALAKAKKEHRRKKKKKGKKGKDEDWSKYPGFENSGKNKNDSGSDDGGDDKKKDSKISKHDKELRSRIEGDVMTADPDVSFGDVVGLANVKLALYETIILPYIRPDLFESVKKSTQGLLLFGPPGNGKTMIAKCVASECDATFFSISASSITSKFVGEAERIMRTLFTMARQRAPAIIFIDEIDSLLRARGGANEAESSRKIKTEFLIQFDGVKSAESKDKTITVIGATNLPEQLDNAVLRRFPKRIMVPNPDAVARYSLIRLLMSKHRHDLSESGFRKLADKCDNYSCSDIAMLCSDAAMGPLRSMTGAILLTAKKSDIPKIAFAHFENSLLNVRASCDPTAIQHYFKWDEQFGSKLFLTMDVLPENMKQKPLLSVEEEKRKKYEAEHMAQVAVIEAQQEKKRLHQEKVEKREQEKAAVAGKQSKLLQIHAPAQKEKDKPDKPSKLLKINAPEPKNKRRKSDGLFNKTKRKTGKHKSDDLKKQMNRPKVLNSKTFKISSSCSPPPSKHKSRSSSGTVDIPSSFVADKKRLWSKRSSKSGHDKKKRVKK